MHISKLLSPHSVLQISLAALPFLTWTTNGEVILSSGFFISVPSAWNYCPRLSDGLLPYFFHIPTSIWLPQRGFSLRTMQNNFFIVFVIFPQYMSKADIILCVWVCVFSFCLSLKCQFSKYEYSFCFMSSYILSPYNNVWHIVSGCMEDLNERMELEFQQKRDFYQM